MLFVLQGHLMTVTMLYCSCKPFWKRKKHVRTLRRPGHRAAEQCSHLRLHALRKVALAQSCDSWLSLTSSDGCLNEDRENVFTSTKIFQMLYRELSVLCEFCRLLGYICFTWQSNPQHNAASAKSISYTLAPRRLKPCKP